jgi:hypothetical protein
MPDRPGDDRRIQGAARSGTTCDDVAARTAATLQRASRVAETARTASRYIVADLALRAPTGFSRSMQGDDRRRSGRRYF